MPKAVLKTTYDTNAWSAYFKRLMGKNDDTITGKLFTDPFSQTTYKIMPLNQIDDWVGQGCRTFNQGVYKLTTPAGEATDKVLKLQRCAGMPVFVFGKHSNEIHYEKLKDSLWKGLVPETSPFFRWGFFGDRKQTGLHGFAQLQTALPKEYLNTQQFLSYRHDDREARQRAYDKASRVYERLLANTNYLYK